MAVYHYTIIEAGERIEKTLFAGTEAEALLELRKRGVPILALRQATLREGRLAPRTSVGRALTGIVTGRIRIEQMLRQLASMISAGVPVDAALDVASSIATGLLARAISETSARVREGLSLEKAVEGEMDFLPRPVHGLIAAGESGGSLSATLDSAADLVRRARQMRNQVIQNLIYPVIVLVFLIGIGYFASMYAMPTIIDAIGGINQRVGGGLPFSFLLMQSTFIYLSENMLSLVIVFFSAILVFVYLMGRPDLRLYLDAWVLRIPVIGGILQQGANSLWCRTLGMLLKNNVDYMSSVRMTSAMLHNHHYREQLARMGEHLYTGQPLSDSISATTLGALCPMAVAMCKVGEAGRDLPENLIITAEYSEEDMLNRLGVLMELIQPFMIVGLGGLIFFVLYGVYGAIWSVYGTLLAH